MPQYRRPHWRAIILGLALLLAVLSIAVSLDSRLDRPLVVSLSSEAVHSDADWSRTLTQVASDAALLGVACAAMLALLAARQRRPAVLIAATFGLTEISAELLSMVIDRPGPAVGAVSAAHSFPSDPAAEVLAVYGVLALLVWRWVGVRGRISIALGVLALVGAVSAAPVYRGTEYPSDVLAGWLTAAIAATVAWRLFLPARAETAPVGFGRGWGRLGGPVPPGGGEAVSLPGLRSTLKRVPGAVFLVRRGRRLRSELNAVAHSLLARAADALAGAQARRRFRSQAITRQRAQVPLAGDLEGLAESLERRGVILRRSPTSIHLSSAVDPEVVVGEIAGLYGRDATFKVTFEEGGAAWRSLLAANLLYMRGLAPRVYDAFSLTGEGRSRTAFVLEDSFEGHASPEQRASTTASLNTLFASGELAPVRGDWRHAEHFRPPAGEGLDSARYLGFENLKVPRPRAVVKSVLDRNARKALHYGDEYALKGGRYLYQSIPAIGATGRRNS